MKFYNQQHEFYCGIDLHANSMHVCVVDHQGIKLLHKNFDTKKPEKFLAALQPFVKHDLILGCESTFNWYWLADLCHHENLSFLLGHALYLKAIHGGKTKSDRIDSEKLAMLLRGGNFPTSYVYPKEMRGTRDLLRRRATIVKRRSATIVHVQIVNHQQNLPAFAKSISYKTNRVEIAERFRGASVQKMIVSVRRWDVDGGGILGGLMLLILGGDHDTNDATRGATRLERAVATLSGLGDDRCSVL